jgi:hypothetical protein
VTDPNRTAVRIRTRLVMTWLRWRLRWVYRHGLPADQVTWKP